MLLDGVGAADEGLAFAQMVVKQRSSIVIGNLFVFVFVSSNHRKSSDSELKAVCFGVSRWAPKTNRRKTLTLTVRHLHQCIHVALRWKRCAMMCGNVQSFTSLFV